MTIPDHVTNKESQDLDYYIGEEADERWGYQMLSAGPRPAASAATLTTRGASYK